MSDELIRTTTQPATCTRCGGEFTATIRRIEILGRSMTMSAETRCAPCEASVADEAAARVQAEANRRLLDQLKRIPERYAGARAEHPVVREWLLGFLQGRERWLGLFGQTSAGKTHNAWGAWRDILDVRPDATLSAWTELQLLRELAPDAGDAAFDIVRGAQRADLLIIDDVGLRAPTAWSLEQMYLLLDHRYARRRPVVFTTNLEWPELEERLGQRLADRIVEVTDFVQLEARNWRRAR